MADITKWDAAKVRGLPASLFYNIPTGGARPNEWFEIPNTYLDKLGAQRRERPPVGWEDEPAQLAMSPDMLNDPAFSQYDLSNIRTYEQDPRLRDELELRLAKRDEGKILGTTFAQSPELHARSAGFTYSPMSNYDPSKIYIEGLEQLKPAVGPLAEREKQGDINKELASTISHEFRHTMFDDPKYSGIIDAAFDKFGGYRQGNISRFDLEEMINRAADIQLMPESWLGQTLEDFQDEYNERVNLEGRPEHLTQTDTTGQFNQAARLFFDRVKKEKKKQQQVQQWQRAKQAELAENQRLAAERQQLTRAGAYSPQVQQDPGGGGTWHQQTAAKEKAGVQVAGPGFGKGAYFADGGIVDLYNYGGF